MHHFEHFKYTSRDRTQWEMTWREWAAVMGAALGAFMAILDIQITNASLREIQGALGLDLSEGGWISTSYLMAEIIVIPLTGFLSEVFGIRLYVIVNCSLFILASILCGFAWNMESMIVFRAIQGFAGGTLIPMAFQVMLLFMPKDKKPIGMAIFGLTATLAPTLGPSLGGWLTDNYGWRLNFFINIVPGLILIGAIRYGIPAEKLNLKKLKEMDYAGAVTLSAGLAALTYLLEEGAKVQWFEDFNIRICFLITLSCLSLFFAIQLLIKQPLLNLKLLLNKNFAVATLITMITSGALYGGIYSLSLYLGQLQGYSASAIGKVMMWVGIPQLFIMPLLPFLMKKIDLRILAAIGMLIFAFSNYLNSNLDFYYAGEQFKFALFIRALGQPLFLIPLSSIGMAMISPEETGDASSIFNMTRNLGGSIGIAVAGTFIVSRETLHVDHFLENLNPYNSKMTQVLKLIEWGFRQKGLDVQAAHLGAQKAVLALVQRDAFIMAFGDIFAFLAFGSLLCTLLILTLRKVKEFHSVEMLE